MVLEILQAGHRVLRTPAHPVDVSAIGTEGFNELVEEMVETMRAAPGVGLAAPQIGLPLQLCVIEHTEESVYSLPDEIREALEKKPVPLTVLVNPKIQPIGSEKVKHAEGCLSVSGWVAATPRFRSVRVEALNEKGEAVVLEWSGWPARILQHEIDHLHGNLYIDHMDARTFSWAASYSEDLDELSDDENPQLFDQDSDPS